MAFSNVLLPAFGKPTSPTSAINFRSNRTVFVSPLWPKNELPEHPPPPPPATMHVASGSFSSANTFPSCSILTPVGTSTRRSTPRRPSSRCLELSSPCPALMRLSGCLREHKVEQYKWVVIDIKPEYILFCAIDQRCVLRGDKVDTSTLAANATVFWNSVS